MRSTVIASPVRRVLIPCAAAVFAFLAVRAHALDWPVAARILTGTFGEDRTDHFHNGIDVGGGAQDVHPVLPGELVFRGDEASDYSSLPRGLGTFVVLRHDQGILTLYAHLKNGTLGPEQQRYQPGDRLGVIGETGDANGPHLHFSVFDEEAGSVVNPLAFLPPISARPPPVIRRVSALVGERRIPLENGAILPPGKARILAEAFVLRDDVSFAWPMAPASMALALDGREVARLSFDALQVARGKYVLSGSLLSHGQVYDADGSLICADVELQPGDSRLTVSVRNASGIETARTITLTIRQ